MLKVKTKNNNMAIVLFNTTNLLKEDQVYKANSKCSTVGCGIAYAIVYGMIGKSSNENEKAEYV